MEAQISFLQGQLNELEAMCKYCAKMMNTHLGKMILYLFLDIICYLVYFMDNAFQNNATRHYVYASCNVYHL